MMCIKAIRNLSSDELNCLNEMIDISDIEEYDIIIYEKNDLEIIGSIAISQKKDNKLTYINHHYVKESHRNSGIGKKLLEMAAKLTPFPLFVCISIEEDLVPYYEKHKFKVVNQDNQIIMVQQK